MKQTITNLKQLTGCRSYQDLADFLGVSLSTINRVVAGDKTKISQVLPMLEYCINALSSAQYDEFLKQFKEKSNQQKNN